MYGLTYGMGLPVYPAITPARVEKRGQHERQPIYRAVYRRQIFGISGIDRWISVLLGCDLKKSRNIAACYSQQSPRYAQRVTDSKREREQLCAGKYPVAIVEFSCTTIARNQETLSLVTRDSVRVACKMQQSQRENDSSFAPENIPLRSLNFLDSKKLRNAIVCYLR